MALCLWIVGREKLATLRLLAIALELSECGCIGAATIVASFSRLTFRRSNTTVSVASKRTPKLRGAAYAKSPRIEIQARRRSKVRGDT